MITVARAQLRMEKVSAGLKTATEALGIFRDLKSTRGMVKSLEVVVQAHMLQDNPNSGLQAANKELTAVKTSGNQRGEVDLLEMIAQTHAMLGQPHSALKAASQAMDIFAGLRDNMGQGNMYLLMADMQRALGTLDEATKFSDKALKCFRAAGSKWGEEQALQSISSLLVDRGQPEKAPKRGEAQKALKELQKAIEMRKPDDIKTVEEKLNKLGNLVSDADIQGILSPVLLKDPSALEFLEEQGWQFKKEGAAGGGATKIKQYPHKGFYLHMIMTGMNFGPQFRVVNPYRIGTPGVDCTCITVSQLPETEAWQMEMGYRPGMLDSGLQCQAQQAFP
uniref:MalT-like TPR region domain-containing protein n=1 Tax=Alexandrium catenella TaxID=2925 RepID=A0A7S1RSX6_ALECA|mmetsp:Transcript_71234/g.189416  ORF Transcript_71234/g.189416 Transcript_71234/m.189416 type:complete len:336 (+) Transcript_71234:1-1008(+)